MPVAGAAEEYVGLVDGRHDDASVDVGGGIVCVDECSVLLHAEIGELCLEPWGALEPPVLLTAVGEDVGVVVEEVVAVVEGVVVLGGVCAAPALGVEVDDDVIMDVVVDGWLDRKSVV